MNARRPALALVVLLLLPGVAVSEHAATLSLRVALVASDLSVRPVAKRRFLIAPSAGGAEQAVVTDFSGAASLSLAPGRYTVRSAEPLAFEGASYRWELAVEVQAGEVAELELANDNALAEAAPAGDPRALLDRLRPAVLEVASESGRAAGFLVDARGLVLTNHHVVAGGSYRAVTVREAGKVRAVVVAEDAVRDLAVLAIDPALVAGLPVLLLSAEAPPAPGTRVLAVGSPFAARALVTAGVVSGVEGDVIYADAAINPGNSGGPLLDERGVVVGIVAFGMASGRGAPVAGAVSARLAVPLLEKARSLLDSGEIASPAGEPLPVEGPCRPSAEALHALASARPVAAETYHLDVGPFKVELRTPLTLAAAELARQRQAPRDARAGAGGAALYDWRTQGGSYRPVVVVEAIPELMRTPSASAARSLGWQSFPATLSYKAAFARMVLRRDGQPVEPVHPGRQRRAVAFRVPDGAVDDVCVSGRYEYAPEAFAPGAALTLEVWPEGRKTPVVKRLPAELIARIWDDFAPCRGVPGSTAAAR